MYLIMVRHKGRDPSTQETGGNVSQDEYIILRYYGQYLPDIEKTEFGYWRPGFDYFF